MLLTHGDEKYQSSEALVGVAEWEALRVEHRRLGPGQQNCVTPSCTEVVHILSGSARVTRRADGETQEGFARAGTTWLVPAQTPETLLQIDGPTEILIVFLPDTLLEKSALADYGISPDAVRIAYAGGFCDPVLTQACATLQSLIGREAEPFDRLVVDAARATMAARLIGNYTVDRFPPAARSSALDARRLKRVIDFVEARLGDNICLDDLAGEACLSPFHFSRLFHEAVGRSPHRYLVERRVEAARAMLRQDKGSLAEIALEAGFGSQANFTRTFRRIAGMTPGQYRASKG